MSSKKLFRFRSFTEQIASVKIDVVHRVTTLSDTPDDQQTFFHEALLKWRDINCSIPFNKFYHEVSEVVQSLPQIVHHKDEIVSRLKQHLKDGDTLELEPLLDLVVQLARDLQVDFYPYFKVMFPCLISLCQKQDATLIERVFTCLAYLFKFLWRHMLHDITNVFQLYSTLLMSTQLPYLRQFAVESFGFLLRKIQDVEGLCRLLLTSILSNAELVDGIAQLMFEVCKGVQKQFHSCTGKFLPVVYSIMNSSQLIASQDVFIAVCKMIELMASYTHKEFALPIWKSLLDSVEYVIKLWSTDQSDLNSVSVEHLLHLIGIMTSFKKGIRVTPSITERFCTMILNLVQHPLISFNNSLSSITLHLVTSVLLVKSSFIGCDMMIEEIVQSIFDEWDCVDNVTEFILELLTNNFDNLNKVVSQCLCYCERKAKFKQNWFILLCFLTKLSTHSELPLSLLSDARPGSNMIVMFVSLFAEEVNKLKEQPSEEHDFSLSWSILKCLQIMNYVSEELVVFVRTFFNWLYSMILSGYRCYQLLIVTSQCIQTLSVIDNEVQNIVTLDISLNLIKHYSGSLSLLQSLHSYYTVIKSTNSSLLTHSLLISLLSILKKNLSCPSDSVRYVTLQILNIFPQLPLVSSGEEEKVLCSLFESCIQVEKIPATLTDYRNKLIWLSKLKYVPGNFCLLPDCYKEIPLRYLLGVLYINFSLLWEPTSDLISSYACVELKEMFWSVFGEMLLTVSSLISDTQVFSTNKSFSEDSPVSELFQSHVTEVLSLEHGRPDHINYRQLLWQCMEKFIKITETRTRLFVPLVFQFIEKEYGLTDEIFVDTQDISIQGDPCDNKEIVEEDELTNSDPGNDTKGTKDKSKGKLFNNKRYKGINKTLLCMLTVLSKCTSVQNVYQHKKLQQLYMKLLMNPDSKIQKLALSCLANYKLSFLLPYQEKLEALLDDKSLKEQLLFLGSSADNSIVVEEHIDGLVPVLVRLLYGRMRSNAKGMASIRKQSLIHSLAACGEQEIAEYVQIIAAPFRLCHNFLNSISPHSVIPLKLQLSFIHEMKRLVTIVSHQLEPHLSVVLPIIFTLTKLCSALLTEHRQLVAQKFINSLKTIRLSLFNLTIELLDTFHHVDLSSYQDDLLASLVWPQLFKLPQECIQHPTPLLRLLFSWSQHKQLYYLFNSPLPNVLNGTCDTSDCPILHFVYKCLFTDGISSEVSRVILELTVNLIAQDKNEMDEDVSLNDEPTCELGMELLKPFIPTILMYLRSIIKIKQSGILLQLGFQVLSWISSHITEDVDLLIELLLPFLTNANQCGRNHDQILTTLLNLIPSVSSINKFYSSLSKLFSILDTRQSRQILCDIFTKIAKTKDKKLLLTADILSMINSWDPCKIDEPHYEVRQEGFTKAKQLVASMKCNTKNGPSHINSILPILHNALYFVHQCEDLSIRDAASSFISSIIQAISITDIQAFEILILGTLVPNVKNGLRSKREATISEFIDILSQLVSQYPNHSQFIDLVHLSHLDVEVDFFKNVCHIQLHRRTKAFRRLALMSSQKDFSQNAMMSYLLPLASHVVFSPLTSREHNMLQEAVNVIGVISSKLKWNNYYNLLKHYLHQLTHSLEIHRNIIRAVVAILDNFHFTISETSVALEDSVTMDNDIQGNDELMGVNDDTTMSERIHNSIVKFVLPSLESCLTLQSEIPQHRLSHKEDDSEQQKLRVPVAMAMTKLMLYLPQSSIETNLPSLLLKVCLTLKNRAQDVRDISRTTLLKMSQSLGPKYFQFILKELKESLTRGYQLHVLSYTIHYLLQGLTSILKPGDLDSCLDDFKEILISDLFGSPSEERDVNELVSKISEGKKCKSPHTYGLVTRFLSPSLLPSFLQPIRETLEKQPTFKVAAICEEVLKKVVHGVLSNKKFVPQNLLLFVHGIINQTIFQLRPQPKPTLLTDDTIVVQSIDSQLLPPKPSRTKPSPVHETDIAVHLLTHFGIHLLAVSLRKEKFKSPSQEILEMIDPLVPLLTEALTSHHVKVLSVALQCVMKLLNLPLPSLKNCITVIASHLFDILKQYAYIGAVSTDNNQELVATAFKCMTKILQDFTYYQISEDELKLLLSYIEQDVNDYKRQSTAFPLLKVIIARKFMNPMIHDVMWKIAEIVVNGGSNKVRASSRHAILQFLLTYNIKKKTNQYFDFFIANINYDEQYGRESVIEMINLIFNKFPTNVLETRLTYFFVPLVTQLINDESSLCRKMIAEVLKTLLKNVHREQRNEIVTMITDWFGHSKLIHRQLAVQSLGIIVDVEGKDFGSRLSVFIPLMYASLQEAVNNTPANDQEHDMETDQLDDVSLNDHFLFTLLTNLEKIFINCGINFSDLFPTCCQIWDLIQNLLLHTHNWVRQASASLFSVLFTSVTIEDLVSVLVDQKNVPEKICYHFFVDGGGLAKVRHLQRLFVTQLKAPLINTDLANQATKNLVYIASLLFALSCHDKRKKRKRKSLIEAQRLSKKRKLTVKNDYMETHKKDNETDELTAEDILMKLINQMDKLCRYESGHHPKESFKRTHVFHWIDAVVTVMGTNCTDTILVKLLQPIYKELCDSKKGAGDELHSLAEEVLAHIRESCHKEVFSQAYCQVEGIVQSLKTERKVKLLTIRSLK